MPARGSLVNSLIDTDNILQDALSNLKQLIEEHKICLGTLGKDLINKSIVTYDEIRVFHTPWVSIVFEAVRTGAVRINKCLTLEIDVTVYYYFQSLSFGNDTFEFVGTLSKLVDVFLVHFELYGFANGTGRHMEVVNAALVGRRLERDTLLTAQINLTIQVRSCSDDHLISCP